MIIDLLDLGMKIIDKIIPDPAAKAQAQLALATLQQNGDLAALQQDTQLAQGQLDINKTEAGSESLFVSGWRPFIGWVCGFSLAYHYIGLGMIIWVSDLAGVKTPPPPDLSIGDLLPLVMSLLGLGGMRTYEKFTSTNKNR